MLYLSEFLYRPVQDKSGKIIGRVHDLVIKSGDAFPRVVALSYGADDFGPEGAAASAADSNGGAGAGDAAGAEAPTVLSWEDCVDSFELSDEGYVKLNCDQDKLRPRGVRTDEIMVTRDLLNKEIFDVKAKRLCKIADLALLDDGGALRLLGAEYGLRGRLNYMGGVSSAALRAVMWLLAHPVQSKIVTWNYIEGFSDAADRGDLRGEGVGLIMSVSGEKIALLRPAGLARTIEGLSAGKRDKLFAYLDCNKDVAGASADVSVGSEVDVKAAASAEAEESGADTADDDTFADMDAAAGDSDDTEGDSDSRADVAAGDVGAEEVITPRSGAAALLGKIDIEDARDIVSGLDNTKAKNLLLLLGIDEKKAVRILMEFRMDEESDIREADHEDFSTVYKERAQAAHEEKKVA